MGHDKLSEIQAELDRQNEQLAEFEQVMKRLDGIDVPQSFFTDFEEACEVRAAVIASPNTTMFPAGIRA